MGIAVNGVDIDDSAIEAEIGHHQQADNPLREAVHEVVLRQVLLQEARRLGVEGDSDDDRIEALFVREVTVPQADEEACLRFYQSQPERYRSGDLVEARHILFQVTPAAPLELLRQTAELILAELQARPERFDELARQYSNCPSGAVGGSLGQLGRGQCVPEFDELLFRLRPGELAGRLLETRFGLHIVQAQRRVEGKVIPFETVRAQIADELGRQSWQRALHQYLHILVGRAGIEGVDLEGASSPLVQ
ncbi:peptidyl-prolyl cis-trans isomerase C [Duganella sp. 1411]|uniref:peptidylprolyl isomerase n=1 Tax=Duganella sp. 1411 TaxID=2806572 RepID=UPI001AE388E0|nr:peptidylprolyl isomerase [Duganella sp. 1411]MBP1202788.1 peptidyl-prolyl cis-trans isomerase C [Duganella sp. 1411]